MTRPLRTALHLALVISLVAIWIYSLRSYIAYATPARADAARIQFPEPDRTLVPPRYCVALYDGEATEEALIGHQWVVYHRPDADHVEEMAISTWQALSHIAQREGRTDLADAARSLRFVNEPSPDGKGTECYCTNTVWCKAGAGKIAVCGCSGPCGSCVSCVVRPRQKE